jgi:outer membrane protein assembly factor BamB
MSIARLAAFGQVLHLVPASSRLVTPFVTRAIGAIQPAAVAIRGVEAASPSRGQSRAMRSHLLRSTALALAFLGASTAIGAELWMTSGVSFLDRERELKRLKNNKGAGAAQPPARDHWPQWRGPGRTGVLTPDQAPTMWPPELQKAWSVEVGEGYSSPVSSSGRVFVHARRDPEEIVSAIDLATGRVAWQSKYVAPMEENPYARQMAKGPYATPLFAGGRAGGRLYTLGTTAIVSAWDASTGALVWRRDFSSRIDTSKLFCGTAMSPLMTASGLIVHVGDDRGGTLLALDPATGEDRWTTSVHGPGYASPIELTLGGVPQIVTMTTRSVIGVETSSGKALWEFPFDDEWNENIVTPIATADGVIVSGVRQGTRRLTVAKTGPTWAVTQAWHTPDVAMYMSSPVVARGTLYGHSSKRKGQFVAMDPESGKLLWGTEGRNATSASVVAAGNHLTFLTTESQLIVTPIDPAGFHEVRRYTVASSTVYAHPIVLRDRVIVRDASSLSVWRLR